MGSCIICGTSVDGRVCDSHQEDVVFAFQGDSPDQLVPGRFYRGTVDGYADFGVFVDLAPGVTGLLHRSELDQRLESLDWEPGDEVFVQVKGVRDNGDIDLSWSIRQAEREFRGSLLQDGEEERESDSDSVEDEDVGPTVTHRPTPEEDAPRGGDGTGGGTATTQGGSISPGAEASVPSEAQPTGDRKRVPIETLENRVGADVRIEGEVVGVRQTGGPTVFELRDETGVVDCAAFVEAGVRAYPEIEVGDIVRLEGEVEVRREEIQVETAGLAALEDDDRAEVQQRLADALEAEARPDSIKPLGGEPAVDPLESDILTAAEAIRRAVLESRPVVVRHPATVNGYVAGAAVERAVLPLIRDEHVESDAVYHYFERRPLESTVYDMDGATKDATRMLQDRDRHDEKLPLVLLLGAGGTRESADGLGLLGVYGARRVVVDVAPVDPEVSDEADVVVGPTEALTDVSVGAIGSVLAATTNPEISEEIRHLPAVSYWEDPPAGYVDLATTAGYDRDAVRQLREAIALEAYYQSYEDKRELITDILFDEEGTDLAGHVSGQFREKMSAEVETAQENIEHREEGEVPVTLLDAEAYAHRFDFPPTELLIEELHRRTKDDGPAATVALGTDELFVRTTDDIDLRRVADAAREAVPDGGIQVHGVREGRIEFLSGRRDAVADAVTAAVAEQLS